MYIKANTLYFFESLPLKVKNVYRRSGCFPPKLLIKEASVTKTNGEL